MKHSFAGAARSVLLLAGAVVLLFCSGCPRNTTTLDDRTLENRPHVETEHPVNREDPWRP